MDVEDKAGYNDPLFGILDIKKVASSGLQLNAIIQQEAVCEATERRAFDEAISYVSGYMMPFSADTLINLFNAKLNDRP